MVRYQCTSQISHPQHESSRQMDRTPHIRVHHQGLCCKCPAAMLATRYLYQTESLGEQWTSKFIQAVEDRLKYDMYMICK